jgi:hypothetical protein
MLKAKDFLAKATQIADLKNSPLRMDLKPTFTSENRENLP